VPNMACLEHSCVSCDWEEFSNKPVDVCPCCGSLVRTIFDEADEFVELIEDENFGDC
jgi:rRNA maturation endonuclease Nob1